MPPRSPTTVGMAVETTVISMAAIDRLSSRATTVSGRLVFIAGTSYGRRIEPRESALAPVRPVGIGRRYRARLLQQSHVLGRERPADGAQVLAQLRFVALAEDDRGDGRALEQPVDGDLRHRPSRFFRHLVESVDHAEEAFVVHRRS